MDSFSDFANTFQGAFNENQKAFQEQLLEKTDESITKMGEQQAEQTAGFVAYQDQVRGFLNGLGKELLRKLGFRDDAIDKVLSGKSPSKLRNIVENAKQKTEDVYPSYRDLYPPAQEESIETATPEEFNSLENFKNFYQENIPEGGFVPGDDALNYIRDTFIKGGFSLDEAKNVLNETTEFTPSEPIDGPETIGELSLENEDTLRNYHSRLDTNQSFEEFKQDLDNRFTINPNEELSPENSTIIQNVRAESPELVETEEGIPLQTFTPQSIEISPSITETAIPRISKFTEPITSRLPTISEASDSVKGLATPAEVGIKSTIKTESQAASQAMEGLTSATGDVAEGVASTAADIGVDVGATAAETALDTATAVAGSTGLGDILVPLFLLGTTLVDVFSHKKSKEQKPAINASYQFV